jgi:3-oxoacyl-[acyl-carrier protein] reductase
VEALGRDGYRVAFTGRDADTVTRVAEALGEGGATVHGIVAELSRGEDIQRMVAEANERLGRLDLLVNNAGITRDGLLIRMKDQDWDEVLTVNLKAAFQATRAAARLMARQRAGRIVNVTSTSGVMGTAGQANYSAAKAGVIGLTKSVARELAPRGIRVNAIAPGFIETDMTAKLPENIRAATMGEIALGRFGSAEDVANAVAFLASDDAGYITGTTLAVDGGMTFT